MKLAASIDVGSNTLRLLIAEVMGNGSINILEKLNKITRLAEGLGKDGIIKKEAMERTKRALQEFISIINKYGIILMRAVGTSALREARNGEEFTEKISRELNLKIEIITPEEEAELTAMGVLFSLGIIPEKAIIMDIGGGSTEFIKMDNGKIVKIKSLKTGVVKLTESFIKNHPTPLSEIHQLKSELTSLIVPLSKEISSMNDDSVLIGTAGTITNLAAMDLGIRVYRPERINGHILKRKRVEELLEILSSLSTSERRSIPGMESGREDVIIAGAVFLLICFDLFRKDELITSDGGLLEGILKQLISRT